MIVLHKLFCYLTILIFASLRYQMMKWPHRFNPGLKCFFLFAAFGMLNPVGTMAQLTGTQRDSLLSFEWHLKTLSDSMTSGSTERIRGGALAEFNPVFFDLLALPSTFDYPFDSLKKVSVMKSPDGRLKVYSWVFIDRTAETYTYYGVVQAKKGKTQEIKRTGLIDKPGPVNELDTATLYPEEWCGAVYYDIFEKKVNGVQTYFLLGWRANDKLITRKIIDVITLNEWGDPLFGLPVFSDEKGAVRTRRVFEFSSQAVMLLRYDRKRSTIVFDHLSAPSPGLRGQFHTYGPDFTYDGYRFKKGKWLYQSNLDVKNSGQ
jgi:hypothetical protein